MKFLIKNRKYLGSKSKIIEPIYEILSKEIDLQNNLRFFDPFGGTGVVSSFFLNKGFDVIVNDFLKSNVVIYNAFFGKEKVNEHVIQAYFTELINIRPIENWFSNLYENKYFSTNDCRKIVAIREYLDVIKNELNEREFDILLASLIYSADKAANSMGHYDIYIERKTIDKFNFKLIDYYSEKQAEGIFCEDANDLVKEIETDILYLDPPYNSRQYGSLYHVLEKLVSWVEDGNYYGKALKDNKNVKRSKYSTCEAADEMLKLVLTSRAKYIVVSYNDFVTNNSRSQSKVSKKELLTILSMRGKVKEFEIPHRIYASNIKKSNFNQKYSELLLICEVNEKLIDERLVKYPFNYMGGKFKILEKIFEFFPDNYRTIYDLFAGGANVSVNSKAVKLHINEKNYWQLELLKFLYNNKPFKILNEISKIIDYYGLSSAWSNIITNADKKNYNEDKYYRLRDDFNKKPCVKKFIVLVIYSFNNSISFNKDGGYNIPVGKRDLNNNMIKNLLLFATKMQQKEIYFSNQDFEKVEILEEDAVIYLDPPYIVTNAHYNKSWSQIDEQRLINYFHNMKNIYLSNAISSGTKSNDLLVEYIKSFGDGLCVNTLNISYDNSWFFKKEHGNKEIILYKKSYK